MKKLFIMLLITFFLNQAYAGIEGTLTNHLYYPDDTAIININIEETYIGIGTLKICLSNYDFAEGKYSLKCDNLLISQDISINNNFNQDFIVKLNTSASAYRFYIQFSYKLDGSTKTRSDCDDGNFILIKPRTDTEYIMQKLSGITINAITSLNSTPGQEVSAYVNLTNYDMNSQLIIYSYIKNQTTYINENLDDDSFKVLNITTGSSAMILMKNTLLENISSGLYSYIIKVESGANTYYSTNIIEIIENEIQEVINNSFNCPECEVCNVCETTICPEVNSSECAIERQPSLITGKLNLKRDEYYYIPTILIGIIALIVMYVKIK